MLLLYWMVGMSSGCMSNAIENNIIIASNEECTKGKTSMSSQAEPECIQYTSWDLYALRDRQHDKSNQRIMSSEVIRRIRSLKINRKRIRIQDYIKPSARGINTRNLIYVPIVDSQGKQIEKNFKIATLNTRSLKPKAHLVLEEYLENNLDILLLTETWLSDNDKFWCESCDFNNNGLCFDFENRVGGQGGGIALISKSHHTVERIQVNVNVANLEFAMWKATINKTKLGLIGIYRPPDTSIGRVTDELIDIIEQVRGRNLDQIILLGDINIHIHDITSNDVVAFNSTLDMLGCQQHIMAPTHNKGNTLDLIFTCIPESPIAVTNWNCSAFLSDHAIVIITLTLRKQKATRKQIKVRKLNKVEESQWRGNLNVDGIPLCDDLTVVCNQLNTELLRLPNQIAPEREISVTTRPRCNWLSKELFDQRKVMRNRERIWKKYHEEHQWTAYTRERNRYNRMLTYSKANVICERI